MEDSFIMEAARQIASGAAVPITEKCPHVLPGVVPISILRNGLDALTNCPQLQEYNSENMSRVTCPHLLLVGRGCPFVLSGKTWFSSK